VQVYVIHENPDWYPPIEAALRAEGVPHQQWLLGEGTLDLGDVPPEGVFWSRMSASSHTRGHPFAKDHTRAVLCWLEAHGRRVVNGRRVLELEVSKADQLIALRAAGIDVPRTVAVAGRQRLAAAAAAMPVPFISKHNQGGKGLGVRRFDSHQEFAAYLAGPGFEPPVDGIMLLQEYVPAAAPFITRAEIVGGEFVYAITADTSSGSFELCPADTCATPASGPAFALREDTDPRITGQFVDFARRHGIEIAGFEFIETPDGRVVTYDVNTTTNYNPAIEAIAPRPALRQVARYLGRLLADQQAGLLTAEVS
jgi:glutathione synthase/RimK-type ligase-like ATP-grasp enzyme